MKSEIKPQGLIKKILMIPSNLLDKFRSSVLVKLDDMDRRDYRYAPAAHLFYNTLFLPIANMVKKLAHPLGRELKNYQYDWFN